MKVLFDLSNLNKYSFSRLSTYHNCPYLYNKTYNEGDRGENNGFALAGIVSHEVIDGFYKGKYLDFELKEIFEDKWQKEFIDEGYRVELILPNYTKDLTNNYYDKFSNYFDNFEAYDNCEIIGVELEYTMIIEHNGKIIIFTGIIDGLGIDENEDYIIWDSKSKGKWKNREELEEYLRQLYIYSIFVKQIYGKFPKLLCFNQFRLPKKDRVTEEVFNIDDFNKAIDWLFNTVKEIETERLFLPNTNDEFFCNNLCSHRKSCLYKNNL